VSTPGRNVLLLLKAGQYLFEITYEQWIADGTLDIMRIPLEMALL
jgi:hypothetical protein